MASVELERGITKVVLTLSMREAEVLKRVMDNVGGTVTGDAPRRHADAIGDALQAAGIRPCPERVQDSMYFD
jgi:hypothetical protein